MRKHKSGAIASGFFAALVLSLSGLSAQAAVWAGAWDPQFGTPFVDEIGDPPTGTFAYDLGWGGKVKVNDGTCSAPAEGGDVLTAFNCGAAIVPGSLSVTLYDVNDPTPEKNTLNFGLNNLVVETLRYDSNGTLIGFSTSDGTVSDGVYDAVAGTSATFYINFMLDGAPCLGCPTPFDPLPGYDGPVLFALESLGLSAFYLAANGNGNGNLYRSDVAMYPAQINFTPEPGSLALIAIGMLAAGSGVRRRLVIRGRRLG